MRVMLFGAAGQIGGECKIALEKKTYDLVTITRKQIDFSDAMQVADVVQEAEPDIVINACAYTAVDQAETEQILAEKVNYFSVLSLSIACDITDAFLIHLSTDYVFDGKAISPYHELSPVNPLAVYGKTKRLGELGVMQYTKKYIILRTSWVFGQRGNNFVKTILKLGSERDEISVVNDQVGSPTYVGHIVDVILLLIESYQTEAQPPWGIYHCSSTGGISWYKFALSIFEEANKRGLLSSVPTVNAISSSEYPRPAPRPMYSVLDTSKLDTFLGQAMPFWREGLSRFFLD